MNGVDNNKLRVLVAIASYGTANDIYLLRLISEYRSMPYATDIVVLSNIPKNCGHDIEVSVGLPTNDPRSLPFGHKKLFVERIDRYDLFIYSEDDTLITRRNIEAFLLVSTELAEDEVAGYLRFERTKDGEISYPDAHQSYHWEAASVTSRGARTFAFFTNEHAAAYILTQKQLQRAVASGGFLVDPHQGKYDLLCSAATDPYTQCGFTKLICISHLSEFLIHHLPNKYVGRLGVEASQFGCQIVALLKIGIDRNIPRPLLRTHPEFKASFFGKDYYEPIRTDLLRLIPEAAHTVLSVGCGWGATEEKLTQSGKNVVAVALDSVISACARARGVETVDGGLNVALSRLSAEKFDCLLISNVLHLVRDPGELLAALAPLLVQNAMIITTVPNLARLPVQWRKLCGAESYKFLGDYAKSGVHFTSRRTVRKWLRHAGLRADRFVDVLPKRAATVCRGTLGLMTPLLSSEIVAVSSRAGWSAPPA
jgi:2-polyprenyl-3-methyl-5-hydroxy-6-metoxy-1,4-benzoquinol methylase